MKLLELSPPGHPLKTGSKEFTAEAIIRFAEKFDPQPFHTDPEAAKGYVFGGLCASGWHTCAEWMRCFIDFWRDETARLKAAGIQPPKLGPSPGFTELQWLKPVFVGDVVSYSLTGIDSRPLASRPGLILNTGLAEGFNQNNEPVLRFKSKIIEFE